MKAIRAHFEVLIAVARADGVVHERELEIIGAAMEGLSLSADVRGDLEPLLQPLADYDLDARLRHAAEWLEPTGLVEVLRDAYVIAAVDGEIVPAESSVIERLLAHLDIPVPKRAVLHEWARTAAEHHLDGLEILAEVWENRSSA